MPLLVGSYRRPSSPIGRAILAGGRASTTCYHYLLLLLLLPSMLGSRTHAKPPFSALITVPLCQRGEACRLVKVLFPGLATGLIRRHSIWLTLASHVFPAYRHAGDAYPRAASRSRMQGSSTRSGPLPSLVLAFGQTEMPQGSLPTSSVTSLRRVSCVVGVTDFFGFFRILGHRWEKMMDDCTSTRMRTTNAMHVLSSWSNLTGRRRNTTDLVSRRLDMNTKLYSYERARQESPQHLQQVSRLTKLHQRQYPKSPARVPLRPSIRIKSVSCGCGCSRMGANGT